MSEDQRPDDSIASYASAGVDIEAGDRAVELFKPWAAKATRPEVRGGLGGFAGLYLVSAACAVAGAVAVTRVRGVR